MDASDASAMTSEGEENASDAEFSCCASATIEQLGVSTLGASAAIATHSGAAPPRLQPTQPNNVAPPETDDDEPLYTDPPLSGDELVPLSGDELSSGSPGWDASLTSAPLWATGSPAAAVDDADEPIAEEVVVEAEMVAVTVEEEEAAAASPPLQTKSEACLFDMATATPLVTAVPPPPQPPQQQEEEEEPAAAPAPAPTAAEAEAEAAEAEAERQRRPP